MTDQSTPLAVALAYTEAWTSHDIAAAASYLADDLIFDGPIDHFTSAAAYAEGLGAFAQVVTGVNILSAFGDDEQAMIMYEVTTAPFGPLTCAEHLTVADGKIQKIRLTFDTYAIRKARGG